MCVMQGIALKTFTPTKLVAQKLPNFLAETDERAWNDKWISVKLCVQNNAEIGAVAPTQATPGLLSSPGGLLGLGKVLGGILKSVKGLVGAIVQEIGPCDRRTDRQWSLSNWVPLTPVGSEWGRAHRVLSPRIRSACVCYYCIIIDLGALDRRPIETSERRRRVIFRHSAVKKLRAYRGLTGDLFGGGSIVWADFSRATSSSRLGLRWPMTTDVTEPMPEFGNVVPEARWNRKRRQDRDRRTERRRKRGRWQVEDMLLWLRPKGGLPGNASYEDAKKVIARGCDKGNKIWGTLKSLENLSVDHTRRSFARPAVQQPDSPCKGCGRVIDDTFFAFFIYHNPKFQRDQHKFIILHFCGIITLFLISFTDDRPNDGKYRRIFLCGLRRVDQWLGYINALLQVDTSTGLGRSLVNVMLDCCGNIIKVGNGEYEFLVLLSLLILVTSLSRQRPYKCYEQNYSLTKCKTIDKAGAPRIEALHKGKDKTINKN
ncbi:hypothetical protein EVAR_13795_1 [Eumeta japonica]|uniref:Uncharacterized protein n=1 Tax=Eumeta variegata TaxID=151549 RepID=A0A4C1U165_EUMVA|nr:hypothetical protein EVAR_13795_1 [Eumeta japonica]